MEEDENEPLLSDSGVLDTLYVTQSPTWPPDIGIIIPIFQLRKLRSEKGVVQGHGQVRPGS